MLINWLFQSSKIVMLNSIKIVNEIFIIIMLSLLADIL